MKTEHATRNLSATAILASFMHRLTLEDLPEQITELAKTRVLDGLSCAFAGRDLPYFDVAMELIKSSRGRSTIFATGRRASKLDAATVNAVSIHSTVQDDIMHGVTHPGSVVVPVAIAVGEEEGASGADTIVAIVLGYEMISRMLRATGKITQAFRPAAVFGAFGSCAASARLMKLGEKQMAHALGYAASLTVGSPSEGWWGGTMETMFEMGMSARTGILSAALARSGATAAPQVLEGRHGFLRCWSGTTDNLSRAIGDLGKTFALSRTYMKPYPACGANQIPIQVATPLAKHGLRAKEIVKIVEKTRPDGFTFAGSDFPGPFISQFQAIMSLQFCAAATVLGRPVDSIGFFAEHYDDPEVAELARKVELVPAEGRTSPRFEVYLEDGRILIAEEESPDLASHIPTRKNMEEKFRAFASKRLPRKRIERVIDIVMNLERVDDIRKLTAILRKP